MFKIIVLFILLIPQVSFSATITQNQLNQVISILLQMRDQENKLMNVSNSALIAIQNGTYAVQFSTMPVTLTAQQQQEMTNFYNDAKSKIQNLATQLP